jgi:hypothetical protein
MSLVPYLVLSPSLGNPVYAGVQKAPGHYAPAEISLGEVWLVRYLKEGDLVPLYVRHRLVTGFRRLLAQPVCLLLAGSHGFFALLQGHAEYRAALAVTESDEPLAPVLALYLWEDLLVNVA